MKRVHFVHERICSPTNPVLINVIGAGGNGTKVVSALARLNTALLRMDHPGIIVKLYDGDIVEDHNVGRQIFYFNESGMNKAEALINRINLNFGFNWVAFPHHFEKSKMKKNFDYYSNILITCVDSYKARKEIIDLITKNKNSKEDL